MGLLSSLRVPAPSLLIVATIPDRKLPILFVGAVDHKHFNYSLLSALLEMFLELEASNLFHEYAEISTV